MGRSWCSRLSVLLWLVALHSLVVGLGLVLVPPETMQLFGYGPYQERFFSVQAGVFHFVLVVAYALAAARPRRFPGLLLLSVAAKFMATAFLALYFVMVVERKTEERPSPAVIWQRFPKFVLGFVLVSILASLGLFTKDQIGVMKHLYKWAFAMAFFCIGLELSIKEVGKMGWRPLAVYGAATIFNTLLAMGVAWVIFGVLGL